MSFIVYLLIFESFRTTQSRIARIDLYKDQLHVQATCGLHFVVLRNIHSLLGGHFCFNNRPPLPPDPHPLESPSLSNMVGFPLWEIYFRQKMLLRYTIMRKNLPPPDPGLPLRNFRCPPLEGRYGYFWNQEFTIFTETIRHLIYPQNFV